MKSYTAGREFLLEQDFCREALTWRSLDHRFVLPLLGIYEDQDASQLFLVSPYMKNGTIAQWRKTANPSTLKIGERVRLSNLQPLMILTFLQMLEVAQGIQYIHSEGVVHGDLRGVMILPEEQYIGILTLRLGQRSLGFQLSRPNCRLWTNSTFRGYRYEVGSVTS